METLERIVAGLVEQAERRYLGKYRGFVVDNQDPALLGRLKVRVPSLLGQSIVTGWATPCVPYGGAAGQGFLFIPERGAGVWVEFEEGDPEFPIWVGTFWSKPGGESELPKPNVADGSEQESVQDPPTRKAIKTLKGHTLQFEDTDDGEMVTLIDGEHDHVITLDKSGVHITDGTNGHEITLDAAGVAVSDGKNQGNKLVMGSGGVTIEDKNGNKVVLAAGGIQIGGSAEKLVKGTTLALNVQNFLLALATHTHVGNLGAPTSPPAAPMQLDVPLSAKHTVE
jgi:Type VI secretion system/phage-baseplate injector OB domain